MHKTANEENLSIEIGNNLIMQDSFITNNSFVYVFSFTSIQMLVFPNHQFCFLPPYRSCKTTSTAKCSKVWSSTYTVLEEDSPQTLPVLTSPSASCTPLLTSPPPAWWLGWTCRTETPPLIVWLVSWEPASPLTLPACRAKSVRLLGMDNMIILDLVFLLHGFLTLIIVVIRGRKLWECDVTKVSWTQNTQKILYTKI